AATCHSRDRLATTCRVGTSPITLTPTYGKAAATNGHEGRNPPMAFKAQPIVKGTQPSGVTTHVQGVPTNAPSTNVPAAGQNPPTTAPSSSTAGPASTTPPLVAPGDLIRSDLINNILTRLAALESLVGSSPGDAGLTLGSLGTGTHTLVALGSGLEAT